MKTATPITLRNERLVVEIAQPGSVYRGTRFDWSGFITQVSLDGQQTFCVPEDYTPGKGTGGVGICNEFGIDRPVGYDDAAVGESFPKLGIGLLKRLDQPVYSFWHKHEIAELFPIEIDASEDAVTFTVQPVDCRGYAARLVKLIRLRGNQLTIDYTLENTGEKRLQTLEYTHNFIGINRVDIGPAYTLQFPRAVVQEDVSGMYRNYAPKWMKRFAPFLINPLMKRMVNQSIGPLKVENKQVTWRDTPQAAFYMRLAEFGRTDQPQWELTHNASGVSMREYDDFSPSRIALWGTTHVVSVEVFIDIDLAPGQQQSWQRRYEFSA